MRYIALVGFLIFPLIGMGTEKGVSSIMKAIPGIEPERIRTTMIVAICCIILVLATVCPWQLVGCIARREYVLFGVNLIGFLVGLAGLVLIAGLFGINLLNIEHHWLLSYGILK